MLVYIIATNDGTNELRQKMESTSEESVSTKSAWNAR